MDERTARLALPLIVPGQAQKEMTHNEALARLAIAVQASVVAAGVDTPPTEPVPGECWIVGPAPTGAWVGHADAVAGWTAGGWRLVAPHRGFRVHVVATGRWATFDGAAWQVEASAPAIATPTGGDVVDLPARTAIGQLLAALRGLGVILK